MMNWEQWVKACAAVLHGNQIESRGYRYTRPAPKVYEYQWLWDSCFHAITYRWFDLSMAQDELLSLCAGQLVDGPDAGMIPHMIYWQGGGEALWCRADRSIITQPPLISIAAWLVHERSGDDAFLRRLYPHLRDFHLWFMRRRDPDQDHLVSLIHPWEAGWDASPRWDAPMKLTHPSDEESKAARHNLVTRLIAQDCDVQRLSDIGSFNVESQDFNAVRAADMEHLARIAEHLGEDSQPWREEAQAIQAAASRKFVQADGCFDLSGPDEVPLLRRSAAPFVLLFGGCLSAAQASTLVAELQSEAFWTAYPVPTSPSDDPDFGPSHYWRGNVWPSVNWLIYMGLKRYGYHELASELAQRFAKLVETAGFHEYFNPMTGEGLGPDQQSWATVVLDILAQER